MGNHVMGSLPNAPLAYVLGQVVFQSVLSFREKLPKIQESLASTHPRVSLVAPNLPEGVVVTGLPEETQLWEFSSEDRSEAIRINQNMIVFHTTRYEDYPDFSRRLETALNSVCAALGDFWVTRLGMRYIDYLFTEDSRHPDFFVHDGLRSAPPIELGETTRMGISMAEYGMPVGKIVIRYSWGYGSPSLPPELHPLTLADSRMIARSKAGVDVSGVLDFDRIVEVDEKGKVENLTTRFSTMHDDLSSAFKKFTTVDGRKIWGEK